MLFVVEKFFQKPLDFLWHKLYYVVVAQKVGDEMSPRTGRPKSEKPLNVEVKARIDTELNKQLEDYCLQKKTTRTEVVRKGIKLVLGLEENK